MSRRFRPQTPLKYAAEGRSLTGRSGSGGVINMSKQLIMTGSITYAIRGRDLLRQYGFKAYVERTPNQIDRVGCGYSILVVGNLKEAEAILRSSGVKILGISEEI